MHEFQRFDQELQVFFERCPKPDGIRSTILKGDQKNPTTEFDLELHRELSSLLTQISDFPVFSEESYCEKDSASQTLPYGFFWLIDPVDGTREFTQGIPECVSSVALIDGNTGRSVYGMLYDIFGRSLFSSLSLQPLSKSIGKPTLLWSRSERELGLETYLTCLAPWISEIRTEGSIAFKLLKCALEPTGKMVVSLQPKSKWDLAGVAAILERVPTLHLTNLQGSEILFGGSLNERINGVICSQSDVHADILTALTQSGATTLRDFRKTKSE
jgi:myo-inositol-1(or 4)-monophosphatase